MASSEHEPILGAWGQSPSGVQLLVRGQGGEAPLKLKEN